MSGYFFPIALVGAVIAYMQWRTNWSRGRQDLFDRRFALYDAIGNYLTYLFTYGKISDDYLTKLAGVAWGAEFLFDKEIDEFVRELVKDGQELQELQKQLHNDHGEERTKNLNRQTAIKLSFTDKRKKMSDMFRPYLRLNNPPPMELTLVRFWRWLIDDLFRDPVGETKRQWNRLKDWWNTRLD